MKRPPAPEFRPVPPHRNRGIAQRLYARTSRRLPAELFRQTLNEIATAIRAEVMCDKKAVQIIGLGTIYPVRAKREPHHIGLRFSDPNTRAARNWRRWLRYCKKHGIPDPTGNAWRM